MAKKIGRNQPCSCGNSMSGKNGPRCPKCGIKLEYISVPIFGDYALGISDEFWRCPEGCGHREEVRYD